MQYNKNEIQKTNDKKILRKVKKQWVIVSLASFAFLGASAMGLMSQKTSAYASENTGQPNGQSQDQGDKPSTSQSQSSDDSNDQLTNRDGDANNTASTVDVKSNLDANTINNYKQNLYGTQKGTSDPYADYTSSINQGVHDAYAGKVSNNSNLNGSNNQDLYTAAYQGVQADNTKTAAQNMAASTNVNVQAAANNLNSLLYTAYQYGIDFKKTADQAYNDAIKSKSDDPTTGSSRPAANTNLQPIYDNSYVGTRQALAQQFDSSNNFNTGGYNVSPDATKMPVNNSDSSQNQYQTAYDKAVNNFNNGIVYVSNAAQYQKALYASSTSTVNKIVLTANISSSGTMDNLGNVIVDGQGQYNLSGSYTFNKSNKSNSIIIQNIRSLSTSYTVNGDGFVGYNNVSYTGGFNNLFNPTQGNGNYIIGANITTNDSSTNGDGSITFSNLDVADTNSNGGKIVIGDNAKYNFNSLSANYIVVNQGAQLKLNPVELDNYVYNKNLKKELIKDPNHLDPSKTPRYAIMANGNISIHQGAVVTLTLSNNTNAIRVGNVAKPEDTGSGDSGNVTISGTLNVVVPDGVLPTSLDKRVQYPNSKRTDAVIWLGHGMQVLSGGIFNVDAKTSDQANAGLYYAFVYGPYSNMLKGGGSREPSMSQITVLQNGSMNVNMNTGSKGQPIRFAYVPIVAFNPKAFNINLNVTPGTTTGADGVKLSLSSIDVFGAVLDQDIIDSVKTSSGYLVNPYIYHYRRNGVAAGKTDSSMIGNEIFQDINGVTNGYKSSDQYSKDKFSFSYPYTWKLIPNTGVTYNGASFDSALDYLGLYVQLYEDIIGYQQSFDEQVGNGNFVTNNSSRVSAGAYNPDKNKHGDNPTPEDINTAINKVWKSDVSKATGIGMFSDSSWNNKNQQTYLNGQTFAEVAGMSMNDFKKRLANISSAVSLKSTIINIANALGKTVSNIAANNPKVADKIDNQLNGNNPKIVSGQNSRNDTSINLSGAPSIQFINNLSTYVDANGYYHAKFDAQMNNQGQDPQSKQVDVHFVTGSFDAGTDGNEDSYQNMYKQNGNNENLYETITLDNTNSVKQSDGSILFSGDVNLGVKKLDTVGIRLNTFLSTGLNSSQGAARQQIASVTSTLRPSNNSYQTNVDGYNSVVDNGGKLLRPTDNNLYSVPSVVKANDFLANISNTLAHLNDADQSEAQYYTNKTSSDPLPEPAYRAFSVNNQNITPFNDSDYSGANAESGLINAKTIRVYAGLGTNKRRLIGVTSVPGDSVLTDGTIDTNNFSQARDQINILKNNVSTNNKGYVLDFSKTPLTQYDAKTYDVLVPEVQYMQNGAQLSLDTANGSQLPFAGTATVDSNGKITQITPNLPGYAVVTNPNGITPDSAGMYTVVPQAGLSDVYIDDANGNPTGVVAHQIEVIGNANGGVNATKTTKIPSGKNDGVQYVIDPSTKIGVVTAANGVQTYHVKLTATLDKTNVSVQTADGSSVAGGGTRTIDANGNVITTTNLPGFAPTKTSVSNGKDVVNPSDTPVRTKVNVYDANGNQVTKNGQPVTVDVMVQGQANGQSIIKSINGRDEVTGDDGKKYKVTPGSVINPIINNTVYQGASVTATVDNTKTINTTAVTPNGSPIAGGATVITDQNGNSSSQSNVPGFAGSNPVQKNGNSTVLTPTTSTNVTLPVVNSSTGQVVGNVTVDVQGHNDGTSSITKVDTSTPITDEQGNSYPVDTSSTITVQNGQPVISVNPVAPQNQNVGAVTPSGNPISAGAVISNNNGQTTSTSNIPGFVGSTSAKKDGNGNAVLTPTTTSNVTITVQDPSGKTMGTVTATVQGNADGTTTIKSVEGNGTILDPNNSNSAYVVTPGTQISADPNNPNQAIATITPTFTGSKNVGAVTDSGSSINGGATLTSNGAGGTQATTVLPGFNTSTEAQLDKNGNAIMTPANNPVSANVDVYDVDTGKKVGTVSVSAQGNEDGTSNVTAGTTFTNGNDSYVIPQGTNITIQNGTPAVTIKKSNGNYKAGDRVPLRRSDGYLLPFTGIVQSDETILPNLPGYSTGNVNTMSNGAFTVSPILDNGANIIANIHVVDGISGQDTGKSIAVNILGAASSYYPNRLVEIQGVSPQQQNGVIALANTDGITAHVEVTENDGKTKLTYNDTFGNLDNMIQAHDGKGPNDSYYYVVLGLPSDGSTAPVVTSTGAQVGLGTIHSSNSGRPYITPDNPGFTATSLQKDSTGNNYVVTPAVAQTTLDVHDSNGNKVGSVNVSVQGHTDGTTTVNAPNNPITVQGTDGNIYQINDGNLVNANQPNTIGKGYNTVGQVVGIGTATITNDGNSTGVIASNIPVNTDGDGNTVVASNTLSSDGKYIIPAGTKVTVNNGKATIEGLPYDSNTQTATIPAHFNHRNKDTGTTASVQVTVNSDGSLTVKKPASASNNDTIYTTQAGSSVHVETNQNGQTEYHVDSKAEKLTQTYSAQTGSNGPVVKDAITVTVDPATGQKTITSNVPGFGLDNGQKSMTVPSNVDTSSLILKPIQETISGVKDDNNAQFTGSTTDNVVVKGDDNGNIIVVNGKASNDNKYYTPANTPLTKASDGSYHANSLPFNPADGTVTLNNAKYNGQDGSSVSGTIKAQVNSDGSLSAAGGQTQTDGNGNIYVASDKTPIKIGQNADGTPAYNVDATKVQQDKLVPAKAGSNGPVVPNGATIHINSDGTQSVQSNVPGYTGQSNLPITQDTSNPTLQPASTTLKNVHADDNQSNDTGKTFDSLTVQGGNQGNLVTTGKPAYTTDGSQVALPGSPVTKDSNGQYHVQTLPVNNGVVTIKGAAIYDDKGNIIDHRDVTAKMDPNNGTLTLNDGDKGIHTIINSNGTAYQADNGTKIDKDGNGYKVVSNQAYVTINNAQLTATDNNKTVVVGTGKVNVDKTTGKILPHADISSLDGKGPDNAGYQIAKDADKTAQTIDWQKDGGVNDQAVVKVIANSPFDYYTPVKFKNSYTKDFLSSDEVGNTNYYIKITTATDLPVFYGTKDVYKSVVNDKGSKGVPALPNNYIYDPNQELYYDNNSKAYIISVIPQNTSIPTAIVDGPDGQEKATTTLPVTVSSDGQSTTITTSADHVTKGENGDANYYFVPKGTSVSQNPTTGTFHAQGYEIASNNDGTFTIDNGRYDNGNNSYPGPMIVKINDENGQITIAKPSVVKGSDGNLYQVNPGDVVTPKFENGKVEYHAPATQIPATTNVDAQTGKNGKTVSNGATVVINPDTNTKDVVSNVPGFKGATNLPLDADTTHPVLQPADDIAKQVTVDFGGQATNTTADLPVRGNDDGSITVTKTVTSPDGKYVITAGTSMAKGPDGQYHANGYQTNADGTFNIDKANLKANDGTYVTQTVKAKVDSSGNITLANTTVGDDGQGNKFIAQAGSTIYRSSKDATSDGQYNVSAVKVSQDQLISAKPGQNAQAQPNAAHVHVNDDGTISIVSDKPGYVGTTLPAGTTDIPNNPVLTPSTTKANLNLNDPSGQPTSSTATGVKVKGDNNGGLTTAESTISDDGNSIVLINTPVTTDDNGKLHANSYPYDSGNQTITLPSVPIKDTNGNVIGNQTIVGKVDPNTGVITVQTPVDAINGNHAYLADTGTVVDKGPNGYSVTAVDNTAVINNANLQDTLTNTSIGTGTAYVDKSTGKIINATVPSTGGNQNAGYKVYNQPNQVVNWSNGAGDVNDNATIVVIDNAPYHNNSNVVFVNIYTNQTVSTNGVHYVVKVNDNDHMPIGAGTANAASAVESLPNGYMYAQGRQIEVQSYPNNDQNDTDKRQYIVPVVPIDGQINNATVNDEGGIARNNSQTLPVHTNSDGSIATTKNVISQGSDGNYYAVPKGTTVVASTTPDGQTSFQTAGSKIPGNGLINNVHFDNSDNADVTGSVPSNIDTTNGKITAAQTTVVTDPNNPKKAYQVTAGTEITMTKDSNGNTEYHASAQTLDQDKEIAAQVGNQGPVKDAAAHVHYNSDGTKDIVSDVPGFAGQKNLPNDYDTSKSTPQLTPVDATLNNVHVNDLNGQYTGKLINNLPIKGQPDGSIEVTKPTITTDGRIILPGTKVTKDNNGNWNVQSYPYDANSRTVTLPNTAVNNESGTRIATKDVQATIDLNTGVLSLSSNDSKGVHVVDVPNSKAYQADDGTTITRNANGSYSLVAKDDTAIMNNVTMINDNNGETPDKASQVIVDKTTGIILNATLPKTNSIANDGYKVNNFGTQTIDYKNPNAPIHVIDNAPIASSNNVKFVNIYTGDEVTKPADSTVTYTQRDGLPIYTGTDQASTAVNKYPDGYNFVNGTSIQKVVDNQGNVQYVVSVYPTDGPMKADVMDANGATQYTGQTLTVHTDDNHTITTTKDSVVKGTDNNYYVVPKGTTINKNQNPTSSNASGYTATGNKLPTNADGTVNIDSANLDNKDPKTGDVISSIVGSITANVKPQGDGTNNNPILTVANTKVVVDPNDPSKAYQVDKDTPITVVGNQDGNPQYHVDAKVIQQDQKIAAKPGSNAASQPAAAHIHYNSDGTKDVVSDIPGYQGRKGLDNGADTSNETLTPVDDVAKGVHLDNDGKDSGSSADLPVKGDDNGNIVVTKNTVSPDGKYLIPQNTKLDKQADQNYHADALPINNGIVKINANVNNNGTVKATASLDAKLDGNNNLVTAHDQIVKGNGSDNNYYIIPAGSSITKDQETGQFNVNGTPIPINADGTININQASYDNKDNPSQKVIQSIVANVNPTTGQITVAKTSVVNTDDPKTVLKAPEGEQITITVDSNGQPEYHVAATPLAQDVVRDAQAGKNGNVQMNGSTIHINEDGSQTINSNVPGFTGSTIPDGQTFPTTPVLSPTDGVLNDVHVNDNQDNDTGKTVDNVPVRGQDDGTLQVTKPVETADHSRVILPTTNVEKDSNGNYHAPSYAYDPSTGIVTLPNVPIKNVNGDVVGYHDVAAKMDDKGNLTVNDDNGIHIVKGINSYQADKGTPVTPDGKGGFYVTAQNDTVTLTNVPLFDDKTKKHVPANGTVVVDKTTGHILDATLPTDGSIGDEGYHITDLDNQTVDIQNPLVYVTDNAPTADSKNVKFLDIYTNQLVPNVSGTVRYSVDDGNQPIFHGTNRAKEALITPVPTGLNYVPGSQIKYDASDDSYTVSVYPTDGIMTNANVVDNANIARANNQTLHVHTNENGDIYTTAPAITQGNDGNYYYIPTNTAVNKDGNVENAYAVAGNKLLTNPDGTVNIPDAHFDQVDSNNNIIKTVIHNVAANVNDDGTFSVAHITVVPDPDNPSKAYQVQAGEPITVTKDQNGNPVYHIVAEQIDQDVHIDAQIGNKGKLVDGGGIVHVNPDGTRTIQSVVPGYVGPTIQPGQPIPSNPVLQPVNDTIKDAHFDHHGKDTGSIGDIPVIGDGKGNIIVTAPTKSADGKYLVPKGAQVTKDQDGNYHVPSYPVNADGTVTIDDARFNAPDGTIVVGTVIAKVDKNGNLEVNHDTTLVDEDGNTYTASAGTIINPVINDDGSTSMNVFVSKTFAPIGNPEKDARTQVKKKLPVPDLSKHNKRYQERYLAAYKAALAKTMPTYVYSDNGLYVHRDAKFTKENRVKGYAKKPRNKAHVFKVLGITLDANKYPRLKVKGGYISYNKHIHDAYYRDNKLKTYRIIRETGAWIHSGKHYTVKNRLVHLRRGQLVHVKKVVKLNGLTRFYLGNGRYFTSNKTYVNRISAKYVYWTNQRRVYKVTNFNRKTVVRYVKARPRHKATAYKVLKTIATKQGVKYKLRIGYVSANKTIEAYYRRPAQKVRVIRNGGILIHTKKTFSRLNAIKHLKKGTVIRVSELQDLNGITRFYIGNGKYITSNKTYVKRIK